MSPLNRLENWLFQKILLKLLILHKMDWLMAQILKMQKRVYYEDNIFTHHENLNESYDKAVEKEMLKLKIKKYNQRT